MQQASLLLTQRCSSDDFYLRIFAPKYEKIVLWAERLSAARWYDRTFEDFIVLWHAAAAIGRLTRDVTGKRSGMGDKSTINALYLGLLTS